MHLKRWLTSIVLVPFLLLLLFKGGEPLFAGFIALVSCLTLSEYYRIVWHQDAHPLVQAFSRWGMALGVILTLFAYFFSPPYYLFALFLSLFFPGFFALRRFRPDAGVPALLAVHALGMLYIPTALAGLILIRETPHGVQWIFWLLCVVFAGDVAAFYVGTYFGKHKLCPAVSPGKTWEGAVGGLSANLVLGLGLGMLMIPGFPIMKGAILCVAAGAAGQVGDLFESMLKRAAGVKDSGNLLPGHGGLLDRIDALLFAGPVVCAGILTFFP